MLDYNLVIIICPMGVVGSVIGAIFAEFCPEPVIIVAMTLCLLLLATYIGYRLYKICKQEQQARLSIKQSQDAPTVELSQVEQHAGPSDLSETNKGIEIFVKEGEKNTSKLQLIYEKDSTHLNLKNLYCLSLVLFLFLVQILRGDGKTPSIIDVEKCEPVDHVLLAIQLSGGVLFTIFSSWWIRRDFKLKEELSYPFQQGEIDMTPKNVMIFATVGFVAGLLNAWLGIGSAFVINSSLLSYMVHPIVAGNTGQFCSLINNVSSTITVIIFGKVNLAYGGALCFFILIATSAGTILSQKLVQWTGRKSITTTLLLIMIIFVTVVNPLISILVLRKMVADNRDIYQWNEYC